MVQADRIAALFESIVSGRLSRRRALQRAGALGLGVAASTVPGRLGGPTNGALAQEGGEIIVGVSQESVNSTRCSIPTPDLHPPGRPHVRQPHENHA